jgi:hypothetical protein
LWLPIAVWGKWYGVKGGWRDGKLGWKLGMYAYKYAAKRLAKAHAMRQQDARINQTLGVAVQNSVSSLR